jgi:CMP-N,N'-diacetyllegionaminic acid synthase
VHVVALIPARGGSKGIPRKNLAPLAGKPLLRWAIDAARDADTVTRVVVSTDDDDIAEATGDVEVLRRPAGLAADDTPMLDVIRHALEHVEPCDVLVLLQPTSPLRRPEQVDEAVRLLLETGADTVVSVVEVPHRYEPWSLMELRDGRLVSRSEPTTRQAKARLYARNGPAILALRPSGLGEGLYGGDVVGYVMDEADSLDVDTPHDLELAELLLRSHSDRAMRIDDLPLAP